MSPTLGSMSFIRPDSTTPHPLCHRHMTAPMTIEEQQQVIEWLPLVVHIAKRRHRNRPNPMAEVGDLISAGVLGLLQALRRFDPRKNVKLNLWVGLKINGAISDYLRDTHHLSRRHRAQGGPKLMRFHNKPCNVYGDGDPDAFDEMGDVGYRDREATESFDELIGMVPLKQKEKHTLHRYYVDGLSQREIAGEIGLSEPAVSMMITRAIRKLRKRIAA